MERITIDVSRDELNFIREAVEAKINNMKTYFNACEEARAQPQILKPTFTVTTVDGRNSATVEVPVSPWKAPKKEAPYGLKKDGTPKAQPGRKSTKVVRKARA